MEVNKDYIKVAQKSALKNKLILKTRPPLICREYMIKDLTNIESNLKGIYYVLTNRNCPESAVIGFFCAELTRIWSLCCDVVAS
jgi:hypothetical protein